MDKYNEKDQQLYQIMQNLKENNGIQTMEYTSGLLANALTSEMPEVEWAGTEKQTIGQIQKNYETFYKGLAFDYKFLDKVYQALYNSENRVAVLSKYFAGLAILISCLGLFGLAAFTAQKRQKEIGIRKAIGASVNDISAMLSKDFLKLVSISLCMAFPISWWAMNNWLQSFAYRINIGVGVFIISGVAIILITLFSISFQAIRAALANPVKALRSE